MTNVPTTTSVVVTFSGVDTEIQGPGDYAAPNVNGLCIDASSDDDSDNEAALLNMFGDESSSDEEEEATKEDDQNYAMTTYEANEDGSAPDYLMSAILAGLYELPPVYLLKTMTGKFITLLHWSVSVLQFTFPLYKLLGSFFGVLFHRYLVPSVLPFLEVRS